MIDNPQQFSDAMSLSAAMPFALRPFQEVILPEHFVVFDNGEYDLIKGFSKIFGTLLGNGGMLGFVLAGLTLIRGDSREFYDLRGV